MDERFSRTQMLLGNSSVELLQKKHVAIFGLGGVGSFVAESLVRSGIGELTVVDNDTISLSNINRQLLALSSTVGKLKTDVFEQRALDINPNIIIHKCNLFVLPENINAFNFDSFDYIVDCIDTVSAKIAIIEQNKNNLKKLITCLGTGNKLDPMAFKISTIEKTSVCPLAKVMRNELKKRKINKVQCVYSQEQPKKMTQTSDNGRHIPASISFVPSSAGLLISSKVILDLINQDTALA